MKNDNKISLGIRAEPHAITIAIIDEAVIKNIETIKIPKAMELPDALKYVRNTVLDILDEYKITHAGIRITESMAQNPNLGRIAIESVIQESFASANNRLEAYYVGQIASISSRIGIERSEFKEYVSGKIFDRVENWKDLNDKKREAVLCAMGA